MKLQKIFITLILTLVFFLPFFSLSAFSADMTGFNDWGNNTEKTTGGIVIGSTTIDGENFQRIGFRLDFPIGKLGIGLDINFLIDEEGNLREEDWDETEDYLNIIYYIRWDRKGAPLYAKAGGLDSSYIGYSNIVNGYSNMIEYPEYKRFGMEMEINTDNFKAELLLNDFKELSSEEPSMLIASRFAYKVAGKLEVGFTAASDLNEYNGFRDSDDDGYPDAIDLCPYDKKYVTGFDKEAAEYAEKGYDPEDYAAVTAESDLILASYSKFNFKNQTSDLTILGADIGYPIIQGNFIKMDIYSAYSDIIDYGWGVTLPGLRTRISEYFTFTAEYRMQSKEFLFGYFNSTYELERAKFIQDDEGNSVAVTKQDSLKEVTDSMDGFLVGAAFNLKNFVGLDVVYSRMESDDDDLKTKSINGELIVNNGALTFLPKAKGYYIQNNVEDFKEWKTPSTVTGVVIQYTVGATTLSFDHQYTFVDVNGDGEIKGDDETIKTLNVSAAVTF